MWTFISTVFNFLNINSNFTKSVLYYHNLLYTINRKSMLVTPKIWNEVSVTHKIIMKDSKIVCCQRVQKEMLKQTGDGICDLLHATDYLQSIVNLSCNIFPSSYWICPWILMLETASHKHIYTNVKWQDCNHTGHQWCKVQRNVNPDTGCNLWPAFQSDSLLRLCYCGIWLCIS